MKIIQKLKIRNKEFSSHPITKDNRIKALSRYIIFNFVNRYKKNIKYKWVGKLVFYANKGDAGIVGNIYYGLYEFNESMFILHYLRESDLFLDVGANVGHYSLLASGIKNCNSIAIEPVPKAFNQLKELVKLNKLEDKVATQNIGISNMCSEMYFSTDKNTMNRIVSKNYKNSVKIPVKTLDFICEDMDVSILKIDVEGYEKFALEGGKILLSNKNLNIVIIEINFSNKFYGVKNEEVEEILLQNNFLPYEYDPIKRKISELNSYNKTQFNTIFIKDISLVKERIKTSAKIKVWNKLI
ncbi:MULTISPECIES: FkbM family methyltransferase [Flavobacteriaceae]|uniref:FkbM family methyltransferase n=1 Tax=Winogradskyella marincola TaxID=3037795 RepID=A0ABT6FX08_9FLAO|nr:FkbM family methyltransferase [Winogradskyella sp. YYF002]MDG4714316.1 FkbM family methyltransferase [Winogradskyella sp. YYF002]